jgi:hypothetical protein
MLGTGSSRASSVIPVHCLDIDPTRHYFTFFDDGLNSVWLVARAILTQVHGRDNKATNTGALMLLLSWSLP